MQCHPMRPLRQNHLGRMRRARRQRHGRCPARAALHLQLGSREALSTSIRARESEALDRLAASTGGQSLCSLSRSGPVPATKYYEGMAAALAEVRRAIRRLPDLPNDDGAAQLVLADIRARWIAQTRAPGRTGPSWAGYLAGGLDALNELAASQAAVGRTMSTEHGEW